MLFIRHSAAFILLLLISTYSMAWTTQGSLNHPRYEASVVMYENDLYAFNGFGPGINIENTVERYHSPTGNWSVISNTSVGTGNAVTHNGIVLVGSQVWIIGGRIGDHPGAVSDLVWIYDLTLGTWSPGPTLPTPSGGGGAALIDNRIHAFGGFDTKAQCDVNHHFVYDLDNTAAGWQDITDTAPMPTPRNHFATVVANSEIYAIGGQFGHHGCGGGAINTSLVHKYNPANNQWTKLAGLPTSQSHAEPSTFEYKGLIYSVGGQASGNQVLTYNPETDEWQQILTLPQALLAPVARIINDRLIVAGGGISGPGLIVNTVYSIPIETEDDSPENSDGGNTAPVVSAGENFTIAANQPIALRGSVEDDGLPANKVNIDWRVTSGPKTAIFEQEHQAETIVTFIEPGDYRLTLVAYDTELLTKDSIFVTVTEPDPNADNAAPVVVAGPDLTGTVNKRVTLNGSVSDDGLPINKLNVVWRITSGPKTAIFDDVNAATTRVRFSEAGDYRLTLVAYDTQTVTKDSIFVTVLPPENQAPVVDAGPDLTVNANETVSLNGSVSDDGLPNNRLNIIWRLTRGEDTATFSDERQPNATVSFSQAGSYRLTLVAYDTEIVTKDTVEVTVVEQMHSTGSGGSAGLGLSMGPHSVSPISTWAPWDIGQTSDGSSINTRYQMGAVAVNDRIYVIGGQGNLKVQSYDTQLKVWKDHTSSPVGFTNFQPVAMNDMIYVIGSFGGEGLTDQPLSHIYRLDTTTDTWTALTSIPSTRVRGAAGVAAYNDRLYIVGGNRGNQHGETVAWFDEFDPADNSWNVLSDAPTAREQLSIAVVQGKLVFAGGRTTGTGLTTDLYDFSTQSWESIEHSAFIQRAGTMAVSHATELIVIGGRSDTQALAHDDVQAFDVNTRQWRQLQGLHIGRHGGGAAIIGDTIHVVGGAKDQLGNQTTDVHEILTHSYP